MVAIATSGVRKVSTSRAKIVFLIQRRVGYASAIACGLIAIFNVYGGMRQSHVGVVHALTYPAFYVLIAIGGLSYLTTIRDWPAFRTMQVAVFLIYSYIASVILDPGNLHGALFGVYGIVLSIQYGYMRRYFVPKLTMLLGSYLVINVVVASQYHLFLFHAAPAIAVLVALFIYLFWVIFAEEIHAYTNENENLREERDKNKVFVKFGQNISGVVHNLKSTLMSIDGCIDVLHDADEIDREELLRIQKSSTDKMLSMINSFMHAVRSYQHSDRVVVSLNLLVESSVELLRGNRTLKHHLLIEKRLGDTDTIYGAPMEIMQVIDNIVTNAAEAMFGTDRYHLAIETASEDGFVRLSVIDEGVGMVTCGRCNLGECLTCNRFDYGKTTKPNGTGVGMMYVRQIVSEMNGTMRIESTPGEGTSVHLLFPHHRVEESDHVYDKPSGMS